MPASNLPAGRVLEQEIEELRTIDEYTAFENAVSDEYHEVPVGQGKDWVLVNGREVDIVVGSKFVPDEIENGLDLGAFTYTLAFKADPNNAQRLAPPIQTRITKQEYPYVGNFISGKLEDAFAKIELAGEESTRLKRIYDLIMFIAGTDANSIFNQVLAKQAGAYLEGDKTLDFLDVVKEFKNFVKPMMYHNQTYNYNKSFKGYNNARRADLVCIMNPLTKTNFEKFATAFLTKADFDEFSGMSKFIEHPLSIWNPTKGSSGIVDLHGVVSAGALSVAGIPQGYILVIEKRALKKIMNLNIKQKEQFANNLSDEVFVNTRYNFGMEDWGQVALYHNDQLDADFSIPVSSTTPTK